MQCTPVNERIIAATPKTDTTPLTIVQVYAPTDGSEADAKVALYAQLRHQLGQIPEAHMFLLLGDFNAKLGCQAEQWGGAIGRLGLPACNAAIWSVCPTCSTDSQLRSKSPRWYGHVCRILDSGLPKMLFGQVKGSNAPGRPRKIWNDIVLSDPQQLNIKRPYRDAQDKSAWRDKTWVTHT